MGANSRALTFAGVSVSGGKTDKACVAIIDYFPDQKRVFLTKIYDKIKSDESISGDLKIHELLEQYRGTLKSVGLDSPWLVPQCLRCSLNCPGFESCKEPHILWMWKKYKERSRRKKPKRLFTPYTERAVETHLLTELEEPFVMSHAMGANSAPLLARTAFIKKRLSLEPIEVHPELSLWRIGRELGISKSHLRFYSHSASGHESRRVILSLLAKKEVAFFYHADLRMMTENHHALDAFLCAFTAYLNYCGRTERRPKDFPEGEDWIQFPTKNVDL